MGRSVPVEGFDHIIVGAGSAGCTLAYRLGEDPGVRILVLEAGGWDHDPLIHIPLGWGRILQYRLHDWMYDAEPEPSVANRAVECARGKVVGGSSSTNAMAYVRGNRRDYDRWAAHGLPGWSFAEVLPYFKRQESWEGGESDYRGGNGPLGTQACRYRDPLVEAFGEAGKASGFGWTDDYNGAKQEGFARLQMTIRNGRRASCATAYLRPALKRGNVVVRTQAHVTRILFSGTRAIGVEYVQDGERRVARAEGEVLCCGGVINSPQLLMLSGIGDPDHLAAHGIAVLVPLPGVGRNLQDHMSATILCARKEPGPFRAALRFDRIAWSLASAYLFGKGFASDVPGGITAFLKTQPDAERPEIQFLFTAAPFGVGPWFPGIVKPFEDGFACRAVLLHPESRGQVTLASADPFAKPRIRQNFLAAEADLRTLIAGVKMARETLHRPEMAPFLGREIAPGGGRSSDSDIEAHIRTTAITVHHPAGTCAMGPQEDPMAVVGPDLRVRGVEGLRVVDASVMPELPSGNINAAVIMIAERAADLIRGRPPLPRALV